MEHKDVGGQSVHIGNCQVWAAIYYLDSPTDYREFLSVKSGGLHSMTQHHINVQSSPARSSGSDPQPPCTWIVAVLLLLIAAVLLYFALAVL